MTNLLKADLEVHAHLAIAAAMCEAGRLLDAGGRVVLTHLRVPYTVVELISHLIGVFTLEDEEKKAAIEEKKAALEEAARAEAEAANVLELLSPESKLRMLDCNRSMLDRSGRLGAIVETKTEVKVNSPGSPSSGKSGGGGGNDGFGGGGFLGRTRKASVAVMKPSRWSKIKVKTTGNSREKPTRGRRRRGGGGGAAVSYVYLIDTCMCATQYLSDSHSHSIVLPLPRSRPFHNSSTWRNRQTKPRRRARFCWRI
jgi:hypothetical protein